MVSTKLICPRPKVAISVAGLGLGTKNRIYAFFALRQNSDIWLIQISPRPFCPALHVPEWMDWMWFEKATLLGISLVMYQQKVHLNRILRMSWSASLILVLYLSCIAIVAPVHPSGRFLILWIFCWLFYTCMNCVLWTLDSLVHYCWPEGPCAWSQHWVQSPRRKGLCCAEIRSDTCREPLLPRGTRRRSQRKTKGPREACTGKFVIRLRCKWWEEN